MILTGVIKEFKPITNFFKGKKKHRRRIVTFVFGKQKAFLELRSAQIDKMAFMGTSEGDLVKVKIFFNGRSKEDKYFNNILVDDVKYHWEAFEEEDNMKIE